VEVFQSASGLKVFRDPRIQPPDLQIERRVPGAFIFSVDLARAGRVVVPDPVYTGWRAWVDGKRQKIQEFEGQTRALDLAAGRHHIEFRYVPGSVYWGCVLTIAGFLLTFAASTSRTYRHKPAPAPVADVPYPG
jgi:uncharacterized membrane protein YfhO